MSRRLFQWLLAGAAIVALMLILFRPEYLSGRCRTLGIADSLARNGGPPLGPADAAWYAGRCENGLVRGGTR